MRFTTPLRQHTASPAQTGIKIGNEKLIRVTENAARLQSLLGGSAARAEEDIVILNTAALLMTAGKAATLRDGAALAREALESGRAAETLKRFVEASRG